MNIRLFGLLHIQAGETTAANISTKQFDEQIAIYVGMALNLFYSLQAKGIVFSILTNSRKTVESIMGSRDNAPKVIDIDFPTKVPSGIKFYSAHFKFDAFRYLASLDKGYVGLCDLDMVCINDAPTSLKNISESMIPLFYDISDQVIPAYGHDAIVRDLEALHRQKSEGRWAGGEYITGGTDFFRLLVTEIDKLYPVYLELIDRLHHVGDEAVTSAALEVIRRKGHYIGDAGTLGIVGRFWNWTVLHPQKSFRYFEECFLLHLPADKAFMSDPRRGELFSSSAFKKSYRFFRLKRIGIKVAHFVANKTTRRSAGNTRAA